MSSDSHGTGRADGAPSTPWHATAAADVLVRLDTTTAGLSPDDARARLARLGPNTFTPPPPVSVMVVLLDQLRSVIVVLLGAAIVVSLVARDTLEALAIAAVLVINTLIGFLMELRARRAIEALSALEVPHATVVRQGELREVDATVLVPGDAVRLEAGGQVPADGRVIESTDLQVDEAPLTGESLPVSKRDTPVDPDTPLADRTSMVYKGTTTVAGAGLVAVTATGPQTELGRIGQLVSGVAYAPTPFERHLATLGRRLVWLTLAVAAVVGILGILNGLPIDLVMQTAIALAVAAVPEALPVVATLALAVGVHRMARRHALVRRLPAVEGLGSATVVCTDKTRTLTSGDMAIVRTWTAGRTTAITPGGDESAVVDDDARELLAAAARASLSQAVGDHARADPVDLAVRTTASATGVDVAALAEPVGTVPFSSRRKRLVVFTSDNGRVVAWAKGAPLAILDLCSRARTDQGDTGLDQRLRDDVLAANDALAADGLRVLAVARGTVAAPEESALGGLTLVGLVGLADPPAPRVEQTVARLRRAGLRTLMVTGDQRLTAQAIGRAVGVLDSTTRIVDGRELDERPLGAIAELVGDCGAFTRVTPEHKLQIVQALQHRGEIVAMLGDGINDAAALRQADIGVAMGVRGSDVAKQAADIVLQDDRFDTVAAAVEEGRVIFDNIRKFVFYLFSCNVAEVLVLLLASLAGLPLPLLPLQLLWLNLATDTFPALALAVEPADGDVMGRAPRRPGQAVISAAFIGRVGLYAGLITASTLGAFLWALEVAPDRATSVAFSTLAIAQIAHLGNARRGESLLGTPATVSNPYAIGGALLAVALQLMAIELPGLSRVLHTTSLPLGDWLVVLLFASVPAVVGEVLKRFRPARR